MGKYLGEAGIGYLWERVKALIGGLKYAGASEAGGTADRAASIPFGQVDSTSTSTVFTATVEGVTELRDGVCVYLRNGVVASASGFTLNINGLGAKPCYSSMANASRETTLFMKEMTVLFVYNSNRVAGGCWDFYRGYYSDTTHYLREYYSNRKVSDTTKAYMLLFTSGDGSMWVPGSLCGSKNNAEKLLKEVNQRPIDPFGSIVFQSNNVYGAGAVIPGTILYHQRFMQMGYAFNRTGALPVMSAGLPVYVKCAPRNDGSAVIDAEEPYVQALPEEEDGKIYIFLGVAYNATSMEMWVDHPVYYYKDGGIRQWTGMEDSATGLDVAVMPTNDLLAPGDLYEMADGMLLVKTRVLKDTEELRLAYKTVRKRHRRQENLMTLRELWRRMRHNNEFDGSYEDFENAHDEVADGDWVDEDGGHYVSRRGVYGRETVWQTLRGVTLRQVDAGSGVSAVTGMDGYLPCEIVWDGSGMKMMNGITMMYGGVSLTGTAQFFGSRRLSTLRNLVVVLSRSWYRALSELPHGVPEEPEGKFSFVGQTSALRRRMGGWYHLVIGNGKRVIDYRCCFGVAIYDRERGETVELVPLEMCCRAGEDDWPVLYENGPGVAVVFRSSMAGNWDVVARKMGENKRRGRYGRI